MTPGTEHWLPAMRRRQRPVENALGTRQVMIAICNRFESSSPASADEKRALIENWTRAFSQFRDEFPDGQDIAPKHTVFLPVEDAESNWMSSLGNVCETAGNEIEFLAPRTVQSADRFREIILRGKEILSEHGWLSRDETGAIRYGLIHNGSAERSAPLVPHAEVLRGTGCYASFLWQSDPNHIPPEYENSLCYFHEGEAASPRRGLRRVRAERGTRSECEEDILVVPPPHARDRDRKKFGLLPHFETGELSAAEPPSRDRLRLWLDCRITVEARPNWVFITLHIDGSRPENSRMLLGEPMRKFYRTLAELSERDRSLRFHCVTARELVNILHAAEAGHSGNPLQFREFRYLAPAALARESSEESAQSLSNRSDAIHIH